MVIQYKNRREQIYYLYQGITKTGKPKYFFSTKNGSNGLDVIPDGFEIYENPNSQIFLRKIEKLLITELERQTIVAAIEKNKSVQHYILDVKKDYITIYTATQNPIFEEDSWVARLRALSNFKPSLIGLRYSAEMRFQLIDADKRYFMVERFCYRGSVDDWIIIDGPDRLSKLAADYIIHLEKESFYDLTPY